MPTPYSYSVVPLNRTGWGITVSDATFGAGSNAIDGNTGTIWATNSSPYPFSAIIDTGGFSPFSRSGWVASADSDFGTGFDASQVLDGNITTRWISSGSALPHWLSIDMGATQTFNTVTYVPQQNANQPATIELYVSSNGSTWGSAVATLSGLSGIATVTFGVAAQTARYIKLNVTASNGAPYAGIAEVNIGNVAPPTFDTVAVLPRQDGFLDFAGSIEIYVSSDGVTWGSPVYTASGLPLDASLKVFGPFAGGAVTYRYIKYNILSAASGARAFMGAAEINVGARVPVYVVAPGVSAPITNTGAGATHQMVKGPQTSIASGGDNYGYIT